jgi:hypothetical protein
MHEKDLTGAQRELADALKHLRPATVGLDPGAMMFRAGQASATRRLRAWQAAATVLVACLAAAVALRPDPVVETRIVHVPADTPAATLTEAVAVDPLPPAAPIRLPFIRTDADSPLGMRQRVLTEGMDALPTPPPPAPPTTIAWETLLGRPAPPLGLLGLWTIPTTRGEL